MPADRRSLRSELQRKRDRGATDGGFSKQTQADILSLPLLDVCQLLARQPELIHDPRLAAAKLFLTNFVVPLPPKLSSSGPCLLNIELRLLPRIVQLVQHCAEDLAACAAVCRDLHAVSKPMLAVQREHIWHSSNINLPLLLVRRGQPNRWMSFDNGAALECYEAGRDSPQTVLRVCSVFRAGEHAENFNALHGYYSLTNIPVPGRYQGGLWYPYIGMSREGAANCSPQLSMHPPDGYDWSIVLAFVCPESGFYLLSGVTVRLHDDRGSGPVVLVVSALRAGGEVEQLLRIQVEGRQAQGTATTPISVQLCRGERIAFALTIGRDGPPLEGGFRFGATRLTWSIRHGILDE